MASLAAAAAATAPPTAASDDAPFSSIALRVPGRPVQIWADRLGTPCRNGGSNLLVLSVEGTPPSEQRHWSAFACGSHLRDAAGPAEPGSRVGSDGTPVSAEPVEPIWSERLPSAIVGVETAEVEAAWPGVELLQIGARGVRVSASDGSRAARDLQVPGGLPLPLRTREVSRWPVAANWEGTGRTSALLPSARGGWLLPFDGSPPREIALPIVSDYETPRLDPPVEVRELLTAHLTWPQLEQGEDDGDGHEDLFAMWRFGVSVFRAGSGGLPASPTRTMRFQPFSHADELRHEATNVRMLARDLDGDGLTDLVVDRTMGGILNSYASTQVHLNRGSGARLDRPADAELDVRGGIASVDVVDLDGDGRSELFQTLARFNATQILRFIVTGRARVELTVLHLAPDVDRDGEGGGVRLLPSWSDAVTLELDFSEGRIAGHFPDLRGDWNGDGRRDLLYPDGERRVGIRLGVAGPDGPGFGARAGWQDYPIGSGQIWIGDLDGDLLDDLIAYDPRDLQGHLFWLRNRGLLPREGAPELRPRPGGEPIGAEGSSGDERAPKDAPDPAKGSALRVEPARPGTRLAGGSIL